MQRRAIRIEIAIVLALTFGMSAAGALLALLRAELERGGIANTQSTLNASTSAVQIIDVLSQLLPIAKLFAAAALGAYLLWNSGISLAQIGLRKPDRHDGVWGVLLAAAIGMPGLGLYLVARTLGFNGQVIPSGLGDHWWSVPILVLSAIANSAAEELIVVAYLTIRLRHLGWSDNKSLAASALLRGCYHLYQGFGAGLGNVVMGVVFGRYFQKTSRIWPLIIAHALIDIVAFVGYALLKPHLSWLP